MPLLAGMVLIEPGPRSEPAGANNPTWESLAERARFNPRQLSALAGVSLRTLQRHFARHYQLTVGKFLYKLRMREALKRLYSGQSVKAISFDLGFKQVSHFSRVFKGFYGAPPSCWLRGPLEGIVFEEKVEMV